MNNKINFLIAIILPVLFSCRSEPQRPIASSSSPIPLNEQQIIFSKLMDVINDSTKSQYKDSLAILIIPIDASCPFCRDRCIDYLNKYLNQLPNNHIAIITGNGMKAIHSYFSSKNKRVPSKDRQVYFDGTNSAYLNNLIFLHPTFYYCNNGKAYEKIKSVPVTVKNDLNRFFQIESN